MSNLAIEVSRCYHLNQLYQKLTHLIGDSIKSSSISHVLSRWVMNEKRHAYKDPLLPDGYLAYLILSDIKDLQHGVTSEVTFTCNEIQDLCQETLQNFRSTEPPSDVTSQKRVISGRFVEMVRVVVSCPSLEFDKTLDIPEPIYLRLETLLGEETAISLALRYDALNSLNNQLALDPVLTDSIHRSFDVKGELFASAFNMHYLKEKPYDPLPICSLFPDLEKPAGSMCSFFDFEPKEDGFYIANPPYDLLLMEAMSARILRWLSSSMKLAFFSVLPVWDPEGIEELTGEKSSYGEFKGLTLLKKSPFFKLIKTLPQSKACFINKMTYRYIYPCNIHFILVANYDFPTEAMSRILDTYHNTCRNFIYYKRRH